MVVAHTDTTEDPEAPEGLEDRAGSEVTTEGLVDLAALEGTEGMGEVLVGRAGRGVTAAALGKGPLESSEHRRRREEASCIVMIPG